MLRLIQVAMQAGTPAGDYAGAIIIQSPPKIGATSTLSGGTAVRLDVVQRQGVRIYLTVAGTAIKRLSHGALSWTQTGDSVDLSLPVHNVGNTTLHPTASVTVHGWFGLEARISFPTPEAVLPGGAFTFRTRLTHLPLVETLVPKATAQFLNDQVNERLKTALETAPFAPTAADGPIEALGNGAVAHAEQRDSEIVTTPDELEGFNIVKAIACSEVKAQRIVPRDQMS